MSVWRNTNKVKLNLCFIWDMWSQPIALLYCNSLKESALFCKHRLKDDWLLSWWLTGMRLQHSSYPWKHFCWATCCILSPDLGTFIEVWGSFQPNHGVDCTKCEISLYSVIWLSQLVKFYFWDARERVIVVKKQTNMLPFLQVDMSERHAIQKRHVLYHLSGGTEWMNFCKPAYRVWKDAFDVKASSIGCRISFFGGAVLRLLPAWGHHSRIRTSDPHILSILQVLFQIPFLTQLTHFYLGLGLELKVNCPGIEPGPQQWVGAESSICIKSGSFSKTLYHQFVRKCIRV